MSSDTGAVAPYSSVVQPGQITSAEDNLSHKFHNIVRQLITHSGAFRSEADETAALDVVNRHEKSAIGDSLRHLVSEDDQAPREDVTQRVPAAGQNVVVVPPSAQPVIDYDRLAAAILAAQRAQSNPADQTVE